LDIVTILLFYNVKCDKDLLLLFRQ